LCTTEIMYGSGLLPCTFNQNASKSCDHNMFFADASVNSLYIPSSSCLSCYKCICFVTSCHSCVSSVMFQISQMLLQD